jgi:uncharacterized protein YndB with AHSA1/START domain
MEMYHFVTKWFFQAPLERVWEEIIDVESWPDWWQDFKKAKIRGLEPRLELASVVDCEVRGALPYTLRFLLEVTTFQPPNLVEFKSSGDLAGSGKFVLESQAGGTACTYYWDVGTTHWLFNLLGKLSFVRAMMERNHNQVMDKGYRALKARLEG